jgi:hypothetical protein
MSGSTKEGAPYGNQNARTGSLLKGAIRRVLNENEAKGRQSLVNIVQKLVDKAEEGDLPSIRELFDRLDGRAAQSVALTGEDGGPVQIQKVERVIVHANADAPHG